MSGFEVVNRCSRGCRFHILSAPDGEGERELNALALGNESTTHCVSVTPGKELPVHDT